MKYCDFAAEEPAANLACDEALLDLCEAGAEEAILRVWQPRQPFVVLGYANALAESANREACAARGIPILRRLSGGGTVLQAPGCLNFSVIRRHHGRGPFASLAATTRHVMAQHRAMLTWLLKRPVAVLGRTDLVVGTRKVSGNSQRRKRDAALFHGTFLLGLDVDLVEAVLPIPARHPAYRRNRPHSAFLANLPLAVEPLIRALRETWGARRPLRQVPRDRMDALVAERYGTEAWTALR